MQTLQRAIAEIRDLEVEEIDLVAGAAGFCYTTSETQTPTHCNQTIAAYGELHVVRVQDDVSTSTTTSLTWD